MTAKDLLNSDRITLGDAEAQVYEAIATLEFIGHQVTDSEIVTASNLDENSVRRVLQGLTRRGLIRVERRGDESLYAPAYRGWSAAPDQATPRR